MNKRGRVFYVLWLHILVTPLYTCMFAYMHVRTDLLLRRVDEYDVNEKSIYLCGKTEKEMRKKWRLIE